VESGWVYELAFLLIFINYLNLLPIMPLDGGQILNQVFFGRYPIAQLIFSDISIVAFAFFVYYFVDYVITSISIFLSLLLIGQFGIAILLYNLRNISYSNKTNLIANIFKQLESQPLRFQQKFQKIQTVLPSLMQAKAKLYEIVLGLLLYFAALFAPLYALNVYSNGALMMIFEYQMGDESYLPNEEFTLEYWQDKVDASKSPEDKFDVYIQMLDLL